MNCRTDVGSLATPLQHFDALLLSLFERMLLIANIDTRLFSASAHPRTMTGSAESAAKVPTCVHDARATALGLEK
jgi:hypothetical protein